MALYKYFNPERTECIRDRTLRFSPAGEFNDPFEFVPSTAFAYTPEWIDRAWVIQAETIHWDAAVEYVKRGTKTDINSALAEGRSRFDRLRKADPALLAKIALRTCLSVRNTIGVCCFSRIPPDDPKALLLWAHYTQGHQGFCVEFDETHSCFEPFRQPSSEYRMDDVRYTSERARWNPGVNDIPGTRELLLTKSVHWRYEEEVRMLAALEGAALKPDWKNMNTLFSFPHAAVRRVVFGLNCTEVCRRTIFSVVHSTPLYTHLTGGMYRADYHPEEYKLALVRDTGVF